VAIKRYIANKDNTITNAYKSNLSTRGTGSNMGASDTLEIFSIYAQANTSSAELARVLIQFPSADIATDRLSSTIPASGSVNFILKLYNAEHSLTLPKDFKATVNAVSTSWSEGFGLDMETYKDEDLSNWLTASKNVSWVTAGADVYVDASSSFEMSFLNGTEDLEVDITQLVEQWVNSTGNVLGSKTNYGILIKLTASHEAYFSSSTGENSGSGTSKYVLHNVTGASRSYYTKRFFGKGTEYFYKRPVIEAQWDSSTQDDRGNFYYSSSLASAADNLNTLYLYNYVRGQLKNIPGVDTGTILVSLYSGSTTPSGSKLYLYDGNTNITGGYVTTGTYSASLAITATATPLITLNDVWHSASVEYYSGSIFPDVLLGSGYNPSPKFVTACTNLKSTYHKDENARFRFYIREKNWNPTIYSKATMVITGTTIDNAYYKIIRISDDKDVIEYGSGSTNYTKTSFDVSGNYFDLDMKLLEPDYQYGIKFVYYINNSYHEQSELFSFRVEQ